MSLNYDLVRIQSCIVHLVFIQAHLLDAWVSSSSVQCAVHPVYIYWFILSAWVSSSTVQCILCTPNRVYICDSMCIRCTMHRTGCIVHSYYNEAGCTVSGQDHICREWYFRMAVACQERIAYPVIVSGIFGWLWVVKCWTHDGCRDSEWYFCGYIGYVRDSKTSCTLQGIPYSNSFIVHACHMGPAKTIDYN